MRQKSYSRKRLEKIGKNAQFNWIFEAFLADYRWLIDRIGSCRWLCARKSCYLRLKFKLMEAATSPILFFALTL
jgi:hypothetical protein